MCTPLWRGTMAVYRFLASALNKMSVMCQISKAIFWLYDMPISYVCTELLGIPCFPVFEDNQGAVQLAQNPVTNSNSKHIGVRQHFLREFVRQRGIKAVVNTVGGLLASRRVFRWLPLGFFCSYSTNSLKHLLKHANEKKLARMLQCTSNLQDSCVQIFLNTL